MSLSIGTLVGYLQLDDSNFNRKADNADRKLNALKLHLEALKRENPHISVEVDAQTAKIDELKVKIADLKAQAAAGADVRVDIVQAMVDLDRVQTKVRELHGKTVKLDVQVEGAEAANAKLDHAARDRKVDFQARGLSGMVTALVALGPALIPITAAAGGLVAALGAPIVATAGGGTLYALIAGQAVKQTEKQATAIAALKKKVDAAQVSLNKASTPAGRKSAAATLAADTAAYNAALAKLNPQQQKFLAAQHEMGTAFTTLMRTAGPSVFGPLTLGMEMLAKDMPKVSPVLKSVSGALTDLMREASRSGALGGLLDFLAKFSGPSIRDAGHILGNIAVGLGAIGMAFMPVGKSVTQGLLAWSDGFAKIGSSKGLSDFVSYIQHEGPVVARTLGDVGSAILHIAEALAPIGDVSLKAIDLFAKAIKDIPTNVLGPLVIALVGLFSGPWVAAAAGAVALFENLFAKSSAFRGEVSRLSSAIGTNLQPIFDQLAATWRQDILPTLQKISPELGQMAAKALVVGSAFLGKVLPPMIQVSGWLIKTLLPAFVRFEHFKFNAVIGSLQLIGSVFKGAWNNAIAPVIRLILGGFASMLSAAGLFVSGMAKIPGVGHAFRGLAADINNAAQHAWDLANAIHNINSKTVTIDVRVNIGGNSVDTTGKGPLTPGGILTGGGRGHTGHRKAGGGLLVGPGTATSDSIPVLGSNGEFMVQAAAVKHYGVQFFEAANAMRLASGGSVSNPSSKSHQRALARARQNLRRTRLEIELKDAEAKLKRYNSILTQADNFASAFAPNAFSNVASTKDITVPGGVTTQVINGQVVTTHGAGTTKTVNLTNKQLLGDMLKYAQQQDKQDAQLAKNVKKLKSYGVSKNIIEQMEAAGPAGIAQINALASGTKAQVKQFNALNSAAQNSLNEAGAQGVAGQRYQKLKNQAAQEQTIVKGIQKALKNMKLQVAGGNLRLV